MLSYVSPALLNFLSYCVQGLCYRGAQQLQTKSLNVEEATNELIDMLLEPPQEEPEEEEEEEVEEEQEVADGKSQVCQEVEYGS